MPEPTRLHMRVNALPQLKTLWTHTHPQQSTVCMQTSITQTQMGSVKCEMWNMKCEIWNVKCEMFPVTVRAGVLWRIRRWTTATTCTVEIPAFCASGLFIGEGLLGVAQLFLIVVLITCVLMFPRSGKVKSLSFPFRLIEVGRGTLRLNTPFEVKH